MSIRTLYVCFILVVVVYNMEFSIFLIFERPGALLNYYVYWDTTKLLQNRIVCSAFRLVLFAVPHI